MAGTRSSTKMSLRHNKKSKNCSKFTPKTEDESQMCVICLDKISCRGKLGSCQHWFCFDCIYEWSKVSIGLLEIDELTRYYILILFSLNEHKIYLQFT